MRNNAPTDHTNSARSAAPKNQTWGKAVSWLTAPASLPQ